MIPSMTRPLLLLALVVALAFGPTLAPALAQERQLYFAETGHSLDTRFLAAFEGLGGSQVLGFPITESFYDEDGLLLQYLENARLELAPQDQSSGLQVQLAPLGVIMGGWDLPLERGGESAGIDPGCRYFPESGHQVCHAFLDYYLAHGGPEALGLPISEFRLEGERIVQYFERLRLDWHPEAAADEWVRPGPLGRDHFALAGYGSALLDPRDPPAGADYQVYALQVQPSVEKPLVTSDDLQQVHLVVRDQNLKPVQGAGVLLAVYLPEGLQVQLLPPTDAAGVTSAELVLSGAAPGSRVDLDFTVQFHDLTALARDSFFVWW
jgi:hypothetical protein